MLLIFILVTNLLSMYVCVRLYVRMYIYIYILKMYRYINNMSYI